MTDGDGIDRTGITPQQETNTTGFSRELSQYLYPKLSTIANDEFTAEDIQNYGLTVSNGAIDISSTKKLINYLKAYVRKIVNDSAGDISSKLDASDYIIDSVLDSESDNPLKNSVIAETISGLSRQIGQLSSQKTNVGHSHELSDIVNAETRFGNIEESISNKASSSDLNNHKRNYSNPHNVTASQVGVTWTPIEVLAPYDTYLYVCYPLKLVRITKFFSVTLTKEGWANTPLLIPKEYQPSNPHYFIPSHGVTQSQRLMCRTTVTPNVVTDMNAGNGLIQIWGTKGDTKTVYINTIYYCDKLGNVSGGSISL